MILFHPETWITLFQKNRVVILCESTEGAPLWCFSPVFSLIHLPMKYHNKYISDFHFPWYIFQLLLLSLFDWKTMVSHFQGRLTNIPNIFTTIPNVLRKKIPNICCQISLFILQYYKIHLQAANFPKYIPIFTRAFPSNFCFYKAPEPYCSFSKIIWFEVEHQMDEILLIPHICYIFIHR